MVLPCPVQLTQTRKLVRVRARDEVRLGPLDVVRGLCEASCSLLDWRELLLKRLVPIPARYDVRSTPGEDRRGSSTTTTSTIASQTSDPTRATPPSTPTPRRASRQRWTRIQGGRGRP